MMPFDEFRAKFLDYRIDGGAEHSLQSASSMAHAYFLLTTDTEQMLEADAFISKVDALIAKAQDSNEEVNQ